MKAASAAGHRHEALDLVGCFAEFVTFRLEIDRMQDGGFQFGVAATLAQQRTEFEFLFLPQAHVGRAVDGDADAVAGFAEMLRDRRDEADIEAADPRAALARRTATGQGLSL